MSSWSQFVGMLFYQLGRAHSLREIEGGLKSCEGKLTHLGIEAPARSSLSYVNGHRPWQLFEKVFYGLFDIVAAKAVGKKKFRIKNKLVSLDSNVIDLCLSMYDWARFRRAKGAVKLHLVLDHDGYLPCFGLVTDGSVADVKAAWQIAFAPSTIVVDDLGYNDYRLFAKWTGAGVFFVTRMKDNAQSEVIKERESPQNRGILKDQVIRLSGTGAQEKCPHLLRCVEVIREDAGDILVFLTNHHGLGASTIAAIYKDRWQIELFFKAIKQNLKIKTFVGTSATICTMRASALSRASLVTSMTSAPSPLTMPANTLSPGCLFTGMDSPVTGTWSTAELLDVTWPSAGMNWPGLTITLSPRCNSSPPTSIFTASRCTMAVLGASSASASMAFRARSMAMCSSA